MIRYSDSEKQKLLSFPLDGVLAACGKRTDHKGYMYYSPFRDESAPSFHIDERTNRWYDFGTAEGGGLIDLVCRLKNCDRTTVMEVIASLDPSFVHIPCEKNNTHYISSPRPSSVIHIENVSDEIRRYGLLEYGLGERKIPMDYLRRFCKEVSYRIEGRPASLFYAIGFPNNSGGWVLRSSKTKICSRSDVTTMDRSGTLGGTPSSRKAFVFEGFFDMLSWRVLFGDRSLSCDVCVLNSVSNWKKALGWLSSHAKLCLCLDNDEAGRRTVSELAQGVKKINGNLQVWDMSPSYASYKDVGEMLETEGVSRGRQQTIR